MRSVESTADNIQISSNESHQILNLKEKGGMAIVEIFLHSDYIIAAL